MALNRGARPGATLRLPLLCDPIYRARRGAIVAAAILPGMEDDESERAAAKAAAGIRAAEDRFADTLDPAHLPASVEPGPDGEVSHVVIRALSGAEFEAADAAVPPALAAQPMAALFRQQAERVRRGLVWMDGDPPDRSGPYDVAALAKQLGPMWPDVRSEVSARIVTLSTLGERVGSSSAPCAGEPT